MCNFNKHQEIAGLSSQGCQNYHMRTGVSKWTTTCAGLSFCRGFKWILAASSRWGRYFPLLLCWRIIAPDSARSWHTSSCGHESCSHHCSYIVYCCGGPIRKLLSDFSLLHGIHGHFFEARLSSLLASELPVESARPGQVFGFGGATRETCVSEVSWNV